MGIDIHLTIAVRRRESAHRATGDLVWSGENLEPETTEALAEVRRRLVDDAAEWHDGLERLGVVLAVDEHQAFWVHQREQIDHPVPPGWWVCHEYFERPDASGSRRVAVGQHRGEAHARGRSNASRWPAPADVPEEALGYPPAPEDGGPDVNEALDSLARVGAAVIENALKRTSRVIPDWEIVLECESDAGDRWRLHAWRGRVETVGYVWPDVTAFNREEER